MYCHRREFFCFVWFRIGVGATKCSKLLYSVHPVCAQLIPRKAFLSSWGHCGQDGRLGESTDWYHCLHSLKVATFWFTVSLKHNAWKMITRLGKRFFISFYSFYHRLLGTQKGRATSSQSIKRYFTLVYWYTQILYFPFVLDSRRLNGIKRVWKRLSECFGSIPYNE